MSIAAAIGRAISAMFRAMASMPQKVVKATFDAAGRFVKVVEEVVAGTGGAALGGDVLDGAAAEASQMAANVNEAVAKLDNLDKSRKGDVEEAEWRSVVRATRRYAEYVVGRGGAREPSFATLPERMRERVIPVIKQMTPSQARDILADSTGTVAMMHARGGTLRAESKAMRAKLARSHDTDFAAPAPAFGM